MKFFIYNQTDEFYNINLPIPSILAISEALLAAVSFSRILGESVGDPLRTTFSSSLCSLDSACSQFETLLRALSIACSLSKINSNCCRNFFRLSINNELITQAAQYQYKGAVYGIRNTRQPHHYTEYLSRLQEIAYVESHINVTFT